MQTERELLKYVAKHQFMQQELMKIVRNLDNILEDLDQAKKEIEEMEYAQ